MRERRKSGIIQHVVISGEEHCLYTKTASETLLSGYSLEETGLVYCRKLL